MNFIILASVLLLGLLVFVSNSRTKKTDADTVAHFWEREREANLTRRKPLDDLNYISLPLDTFPMTLLKEDEQVAECIETIRTLSAEKIVNFTGFTNTDLKLRYGAPNINLLTAYDQNYTLLVRTLQKWADLLYQNGYPQEARTLLEFAVSTGSDVSGTYRLLCRIYRESGCPEKIDGLSVIAGSLQSASKGTIARILAESSRSDG